MLNNEEKHYTYNKLTKRLSYFIIHKEFNYATKYTLNCYGWLIQGTLNLPPESLNEAEFTRGEEAIRPEEVERYKALSEL